MRSRIDGQLARRLIATMLMAVFAAVFFATAATEHGRRINTSKARGDQSGYLFDAKNVYANFHGQQPKALIGERNRMPVYAGYLALFYDPSSTDWQYFDVGKRANIALALAALALLGLIFLRHLPWLPAVNLTGVVMFGWFIYKAAYAQSELLFYTLFFLAFLVCWHVLKAPVTARTIGTGTLAGALCALAYLTKAAIPPLMMVFALCLGLKGVFEKSGRTSRTSRVWLCTATLLAFSSVFLAILSPYLATNKRVFGRYFYNVNSTFYVWYDNWAAAATGTLMHGDGIGWPDMPASDLPSVGRYFREHTLMQIVERLWSGIQDMASVSYRTYDYLTWLLLYTALLVLLVVTRWTQVAAIVRDHIWLFLFFLSYGVVHFFATAFYFPISGTGTARFLLAHLLPYFFVLTCLFARSRLATAHWSVGRRTVGITHFHRLVFFLLLLDVSLRTWPRLMTTYGGF